MSATTTLALHVAALMAQFSTGSSSTLSATSSGSPAPGAAGAHLLLSVRDFGAAGDGTTDDAAAIQRGIDASQLQQRTLWFPAGVYLVSNGLVVHCTNPHAHLNAPNTHTSRLQGEGQHQVTIRASHPMNSVLTFTSEYTYAQKATTTNGHSLSELTFDGNGLSNFSVHAASMTRSKFHGVSANNATFAGMYVGFGWTNQFVECAFHRNGLVALYLNAAVNSVNVLDCTFESNRGIGILINYGAAVRVEGNTIESQGGPAILANAVEGLSIKSNYYEANLMGGHLPPTAGHGLVSFVDTSGKHVEVCADHVLNGKTWHEFNSPIDALIAGEPLVLDDSNPCQGVVIEANYHNPGASLCGRPTVAAAAGVEFSGTAAYGAEAVAVRANRCGSCVPPSCKPAGACKICEVIRMPGANASSLASDVNSGWAHHP
jgi:hypothetical protein